MYCEECSVWPRRSDRGMKIGGHQIYFLNCLFSTNDLHNILPFLSNVLETVFASLKEGGGVM